MCQYSHTYEPIRAYLCKHFLKRAHARTHTHTHSHTHSLSLTHTLTGAVNVADECQGHSREGLRREWIPAPINFDWLGNALLACFTVASGDGWHTILYQGLDSVGAQGPDQNSNTAAILFFVPLQIAGMSDTDVALRCNAPRRRAAHRVQRNSGVSHASSLSPSCSWPYRHPHVPVSVCWRLTCTLMLLTQALYLSPSCSWPCGATPTRP